MSDQCDFNEFEHARQQYIQWDEESKFLETADFDSDDSVKRMYKYIYGWLVRHIHETGRRPESVIAEDMLCELVRKYSKEYDSRNHPMRVLYVYARVGSALWVELRRQRRQEKPTSE